MPSPPSCPRSPPTRQKLCGAGETLRGRSPLYAINSIPQSTPLRDGSRDGYTIDPFFVDRVELIYGSNALQGIGGTGGIVNQVTVGAPKTDGFSSRFLVQGTADDDGSASDSMGGKIAGLVSKRTGAFDATVGAAFEQRGAFYDAEGRRIGVDTTQGEIQDSESWSFFTRFGYQVGDSTRVDLIASRFELEGDGDYVAITGNRLTGLPTSSVRGTPPGVPAGNRTESVALSLTDDDLASAISSARSSSIARGTRSAATTARRSRMRASRRSARSSTNPRTVRARWGAKISYERPVPRLENLTATRRLRRIVRYHGAATDRHGARVGTAHAISAASRPSRSSISHCWTESSASPAVCDERTCRSPSTTTRHSLSTVRDRWRVASRSSATR